MVESRGTWSRLSLNLCWTCQSAIGLCEQICAQCQNTLLEAPLQRRFLWLHNGPAKELVRIWREEKIPKLSGALILNRLNLWRRQHGHGESFDGVIVIPQRRSNALRRLAEELARTWATELLEGVLIKTNSRPQHGRNNEERWSGGVFLEGNGVCLANKHILVIDDVETSGVTLLQAERALRWRGAKKITSLAVAKQVVPGIEGKEKHPKQKVEEEPALWFHLAM
jgi:predicted amidophosphoribosyltransferase